MLPSPGRIKGMHVFHCEMLSDPKPGHWRLRALEFECSSVVTHFCRLMLHRKCTCPTFLPFNTIDLVISPCLMDI